MRPVSAAFLRTVGGSHRAVFRARVCDTFQTGTNPDGAAIPILGGSVTLDATAQVRGSLQLLTDGNRTWPRRADSLLTPYGHEVYVERGVMLSDAQVIYVGLGYFRIKIPAQDEAPDGPIDLAGADRMRGIQRARLLSPRQYGAGATVGFVVEDLVLERYPSAVVEWDAGDTETIPRSVVVERDRYEFLDQLIKAQGKIWYWDHRGALQIRTAPSTANPVFDINAGANGVLVSSSRKLTREGVYNAVVASGEAADTEAPARGVAVDAEASSPTYFYGPFGPVPRFFTSPFLTTDAQAAGAAAAMLGRQLGLPYVVDFAMVPNPALEPWDPVRIRHATTEGFEIHTIQTLTVPLTAQAGMTGTTREQSRILVATS